jgi:signal transduction histidine kinase
VARHARASRVTVEIERTGRAVWCRICDDGTGFDPAATAAGDRRRGIGLEGMRERIAHLGGALEIRSEPGAGTELSMRIPIEVRHEDTAADRG